MDVTTTEQPAASSAATPSTTPAATTSGTMSARDALALADSSSASSEATTTPAASTQAAATAQPAGTEPPTETATIEATGEPPKWRWQDILANARETSAKEAEARVRQEVDTQYAGLKDFGTLDANERAGLLVLHRAMAGDAQSRAMVAQAQPQLAQSMGWTQAPADDSMPEADLQTSDGTPVYSAPQLQKWQEWNARKLRSEIQADYRKEMQPVNEVLQAHNVAKSENTVSSLLTKMSTADPDFKTYSKDVLAELQRDKTLWEMADHDQTLPFAVETAWNRVYRSKVLPRRDEQTKAEMLANLQQRAVSGTTNPGSATTSAPANMIGNARAALQYADSVVGAT